MKIKFWELGTEESKKVSSYMDKLNCADLDKFTSCKTYGFTFLPWAKMPEEEKLVIVMKYWNIV